MESLGIVVPQIRQAEQIERQIRDAYYQWRAGWNDRHPVDPIQNVHFRHDPEWKMRGFSIQSAHDGGTLFWKATHVIVRFATVAGAIGATGMF